MPGTEDTCLFLHKKFRVYALIPDGLLVIRSNLRGDPVDISITGVVRNQPDTFTFLGVCDLCDAHNYAIDETQDDGSCAHCVYLEEKKMLKVFRKNRELFLLNKKVDTQSH